MAEELNEFIKKVLLVPNWVAYKGNEEKVNSVVNILQKTFCDDSLDSPDGYYKEGNVVYIIEHFRFGSWETVPNKKNDKKSSIELKEVNRLNRIDIQHLNLIRHDNVKCEYNFNFYAQNLKEQFQKHYNQIELYKSNFKKLNIINDKSIIKIIFCIEDTTLLGNWIFNNEKYILLSPGRCKFFLDIIKNSLKLDVIVTYTETNSQLKIVEYIDKTNINNFMQDAIENKDIIIENHNIKTISYTK